MLKISDKITIPENEIELTAIRAQGAGGQNVNKVSSAIHLRFDVNASSLPRSYKERLAQLRDKRITKEGVIVIKAQQHRTQEKNREDALRRLKTIITRAMLVPKKRKPTRPSRSAKQRRLDSKSKQSQKKSSRKKVSDQW